jgi:PKD repeat protein
MEFRWDFEGDGTWDTGWSTNPRSKHMWGDNFSGTAKLEVRDSNLASDTDDAQVTVNNVPPSINLIVTPSGDEGATLTFDAEAGDPGSDDLSFKWEFELGPTYTNIHYNNGVSPDPNPSPSGIFPCTFSDSVSQTYGDNGDYSVTLTVTDDDGAVTVYSTTITIDNLAPSIDLVSIPGGDEGSSLTYSSTATDSGSDDLTFIWEWGDGTSDTETIYYNDGVGLDPVQSPWGTYPFSGTDTALHTYGDNGIYSVILTVTDDDMGTTTYTTDVTINNVAPTIDSVSTPGGDEGTVLTYLSAASDPGSDDLTFTWEWGDGTSDSVSVNYNDGMGPDSYPSPWGTFPFSSSDTVSHTFGDNGVYTVTLTVSDDDGGSDTHTVDIVIDNVAPTIIPFGPFSIDEGFPLALTAISGDLGSDDLTFTWEFELGPTIANVHYNDGVGPDPFPSPWGTFPVSETDFVEQTYGDNGVFTLNLTVEDDDGGVATHSTEITVNNVAPSIDKVEAYILVDFTLRITGEKWHSVDLVIFEDGVQTTADQVVRYPGNPDEQLLVLENVKCDVTKVITAGVFYTPWDDPVNGQENGATPAWLTIGFEDGHEDEFDHTFNVQHPETWEWDVGVNPLLVGHEITFEGTASDFGSDDLTFDWSWDDGTSDDVTIYYNDGMGLDPFPSPWGTFPLSILDVAKHTFWVSGNYNIQLTVTDDDSGTDNTMVTLILS